MAAHLWRGRLYFLREGSKPEGPRPCEASAKQGLGLREPGRQSRRAHRRVERLSYFEPHARNHVNWDDFSPHPGTCIASL